MLGTKDTSFNTISKATFFFLTLHADSNQFSWEHKEN